MLFTLVILYYSILLIFEEDINKDSNDFTTKKCCYELKRKV